jgi:two-component system sensor histidine kinase ChvG
VEPENRQQWLIAVGQTTGSRFRIYSAKGGKSFDSIDGTDTRPPYILRDPDDEPFRKDIARMLDRFVEFAVGSPTIEEFAEPINDRLEHWPEAIAASKKRTPVSRFRFAPDRTPMLNVAVALPGRDLIIVSTTNARDITTIVRAERFDVVMVILGVALVSVLLSLFLARTIVRPIRQLARSALRVRLGRDQHVMIPRMPERRDEIGLLARALSDMSLSLRKRIEATESFAADVTHEIKNPLASLRSAIDGLHNVAAPDLRKKLLDVAHDDVRRVDRLISDISDASRVDAELARSSFEPVDIGSMIEQILMAREERGSNGDVEIAFARPLRGVAKVMGEDGRLERLFTNLLDNAVSFSPSGGLVSISATTVDGQVVIRIADQGPGVAADKRDKVFDRFHSDRPGNNAFGKHNGLGLSIAKTIVEGHEGTIRVIDPPEGDIGACFEIALPLIENTGASG